MRNTNAIAVRPPPFRWAACGPRLYAHKQPRNRASTSAQFSVFHSTTSLTEARGKCTAKVYTQFGNVGQWLFEEKNAPRFRFILREENRDGRRLYNFSYKSNVYRNIRVGLVCSVWLFVKKLYLQFLLLYPFR